MSLNSVHIVHRKFDRINKSLKKINRNFYEGDIHEFRLEIKYLHAFLQLLRMETSTSKHIRISKRLKKAYRLAGKIRLIQLLIKNLKRTSKKIPLKPPGLYIKSLQKEKKELEKTIKAHLKSMKPLNSKNFSRDIPHHIHTSSFMQFIRKQESSLHNLSASGYQNEENLHQIRKIAKTLVYDFALFKKEKITLGGFSNLTEDLLKLLESEIGDYRDIYLSIEHINQQQDSNKNQERESLQRIALEWQQKKDELRKQIALAIPLSF